MNKAEVNGKLRYTSHLAGIKLSTRRYIRVICAIRGQESSFTEAPALISIVSVRIRLRISAPVVN
jgi:hypothetical protein